MYSSASMWCFLQCARGLHEMWSKGLWICYERSQRYVQYIIMCRNDDLTCFFLISATKAMRFTPTPQVPALQYIGSVEKGSSADLASLQTGDFLLEVSPLLSHSLPLTMFKSSISSHISLSPITVLESSISSHTSSLFFCTDQSPQRDVQHTR